MNPKSEEELGNNNDDVSYSDQNPFLHHHYHHQHHFSHHHHHRQILLHHDEDTHFQPCIDRSTSSPRFPPTTNEPDENNSSPNPSDEDADDSLCFQPLQIPSPPQRQQLPLHTSDPAVSYADSVVTNGFSTRNPSFANPTRRPGYVDPEPHISTQFYTFNTESHALMIRCLIEGRLATPAEIRAATPSEVLRSWRAVWRDRNEDTAYTTGWKRIQEKLQAHADEAGNRFLCFKSNSQQFVSHFNQWQDIVMSCHGDSDLKHFCLRETIERVKQVWTVGAKFYGIPESFIRVCVASCPICSGNGDRDCSGAGAGDGGGCGVGRPKRRRFEYTESFDVPAREVPNRLQQLAKKHKVVLCIRQKYIRHKPFMAEVKDYACHRAGEPASKKPSKALKREPYASKRCGCGFRIRAIVPITDYNEKEKTFVYLEEGMAVFKLYAVHTGHEPGPRDGNARIMHRVVGHKGVGLLMDQEEAEYGVNEVMGESDDMYSLPGGADEGDDFRFNIVHQMQELKNQVGMLERKVGNISPELVGSVSRELYDIVNKVRMLGDQVSSKAVGDVGILSNNNNKPPNSGMLLREADLTNWSETQDEGLYGDGKEADLIDDDEDSFGRTLGEMAPWDQMGAATSTRKVRPCMDSEICKTDKWLKFDGKDILDCEVHSDKLTKQVSHDNVNHIDAADDDDDVGIVGIQVDSFYPENPKLYDSPCGLDSSTDCRDNGYGNGEFV